MKWGMAVPATLVWDMGSHRCMELPGSDPVLGFSMLQHDDYKDSCRPDIEEAYILYIVLHRIVGSIFVQSQ